MIAVVCFLAVIVWIVWPEKEKEKATKSRTVHTSNHPPVYRNGVAYRACDCGIYTKDSDGI